MRASLAGLLTGIAAGFVGVGGGEFRIPVLIRVLRFSVHSAAGVNLLVGLFTVALSAYRRLGQRSISDDAMTLAWVMGIASIAGAVLGVASRKRIAVRPLILVIRIYLVLAGAWMLYESIWHAHHVLADPQGVARWMLAGTAAFAIAAVSGVMGVAGGEMRIPVLLYLFSVPIIEAGTLSLLVSIPTVACGAIADRRLGGIRNSALRVALIMGVASAVGVLAGAALVPYANRETIKGVLGAVLLLAAIRLDTVERKLE
jgi:uncharacterized protein